MAGRLKDAVYVAQTQLGFVEGPKPNQNPFAAEVGHANFQPWCATFIAAVMHRAQVPIPSTSAYTPTMADGFKKAGHWSATGHVGDVVFFHWPSMGRIAHVGLIESINLDGSYVSIEGNTDSVGGRTGGRVMRQVRRSNIAGFGRPAYSSTDLAMAVPTVAPILLMPAALRDPLLRSGMTEPKVKIQDVQRALLKAGYLRGFESTVVDGDFGPLTADAVRTVQFAAGLDQTGMTDGATWAVLRYIAHR